MVKGAFCVTKRGLPQDLQINVSRLAKHCLVRKILLKSCRCGYVRIVVRKLKRMKKKEDSSRTSIQSTTMEEYSHGKAIPTHMCQRNPKKIFAVVTYVLVKGIWYQRRPRRLKSYRFFSWSEVKHFVRCVYRKAGTTLADDDTLSKTSLDMDRMKRHTEKLTKKDAYQLYQRLEVQAREYLNEVRVSLVKFYSSTSSNSLQHAKDCVMTLLDEYKSLCVATDILKPFFQKLEDDLLVKWKWSWELMNKELFKEEIFHDSIIGLNFPLLFQQLVRSETSTSGNDENHKSEIMKRFEAFTWEVTDVDDRWLATKPLLEIYERENGSEKRGEFENWDEPLKNTKRENRCTCGHCDFLTSESTTVSIKRPLPSSHIANPYCSWNAQIGCRNGTELTSTSPTGMFLDRLSTSNCASCMREALHSFCFDQNTFPNTCQYHTDHDPPKPPSHPKSSQCLYQSSYDPFLYNNDPLSPETASSIQNLLVNGTSGNRCQNNPCCTQHYGQCDDKRYKEQKGHCIPPSITIPGNDSNVEAPPSSPSSDRSVGDGSSCDSPPSPCSLSDDSKSNNGKYCDCCYCEFFGQGNPPVAQTSHNFVEMREKLRSRLKERKAIDFPDNPKALRCITDTRSVDELLTFINGDEERNVSNKTATKAAKRQRKKQKKAVEKGDISCQDSGLSEPKGKQEGRPLICKVESEKASQQESDKRKSQESLTEKKNAENYLKSLNNITKQEETTAKHGQGVGVKLKTVNHANVQKKNKAEKEVVTKDGEHKKTRMANGYSSKCANFVEESHEQRFSAGKKDESKCCDEEEVPSQETDYQKRKTKNRKKKKAQCLDDVFLPKDNSKNGHDGEVDEAEREIEEFKRFCANVAPVTRKLKLPANLNLKNLNLSLKKS
ncbi:protein FAM193A-like isoform X2 [Xenia sp. Carnegie-2017]|uniref:protein FAM193A-like isoform X2 n=1 Tax=Xenia sp. Carnegie-2017 TaxID=2897299 RepID=UPI001F04561E|nr:protein FAM193A-like isoform X2 [Xenia sp. Carnegie-2017]